MNSQAYWLCVFFFFLMIRRPPRSTQSRSSAASDVYKRQVIDSKPWCITAFIMPHQLAVSYTHLRAHETRHDLVCRLLLEKKKKNKKKPLNKTKKQKQQKTKKKKKKNK